MKLTDLLRGARASGPNGPRPRRRARRHEAPRTIIPVDEPTGAQAATTRRQDPAPSPFDLQVDAARERLRRAIPPVDDDA